VGGDGLCSLGRYVGKVFASGGRFHSASEMGWGQFVSCVRVRELPSWVLFLILERCVGDAM
jgi:hypothetical protein